ncbi:MAG TPA: hypothetical protein VN776_08465 [Terracidiphilus sp.]|nr:hypothetical protein [Terracidiphilus sp.]
MPASWLRFTLCIAVVTGLAGCGGSSNGGSGGGGGGNPTIVTYTFKGTMPTAVATQIGTGAFTQASLDSGTLTISVPNGTTDYAVAYACPPDTLLTNPSITEQVIFASTLDGVSFSPRCGATVAVSQGLATVQVNAAAIPGAAFVKVGSLLGQIQPWSGSTLSFSANLFTGTQDIPVSVMDASLNVLAARTLRGQTVPGALNGGNPVVFAASDETVPETATLNDIPTGFSVLAFSAFYQTDGGALISLSVNQTPHYSAMPAGAFQSGDYYLFLASAFNNKTLGDGVSVETTSASAGPQSFTFPAPWSYSGPTAAALPTFDFDYTGFSGMSNVSRSAFIWWVQGTASINTISIAASANYQNGATTVAVPDLSSLTGFLAPAASGTTIGWRTEVHQGNPFLTTPPNGTLQFVSNAGTYTEP